MVSTASRCSRQLQRPKSASRSLTPKPNGAGEPQTAQAGWPSGRRVGSVGARIGGGARDAASSNSGSNGVFIGCLREESSASAEAPGDMAEPGAGRRREALRVEARQEDARLFRDRVEEGRGLGRSAAKERPGDADLTHGPRQPDVGEPALLVEI